MSIDATEPAAAEPCAAILARAGAADLRAERRMATEIEDFALSDDGRLDDQTRAAIARLARIATAAVERDLVARAARNLALSPGDTLGRLVGAGLLRDRALMEELIARARQERLAAALEHAVPRDEQSALLSRLADCADGIVARAASALFVAENRRRTAPGERADLPPPLHERLTWWVAAALREAARDGSRPAGSVDRALAEAATRTLAAQDADDRVEPAAMRLAGAIDARPEELGELLVDALADARVSLFVAAIAHADGLAYDAARAIVLDPDGDRLWLVLRAQGLERATIARIGLMLATADPRRDLEAFADLLDSIAAIERDVAAAALAPMRLHPDFRAAMRALAQSQPVAP